MCGIAGILRFDDSSIDVNRLKPMVDVIAHRGPDDAGYLVCRTGGGNAYTQAFTDTEFCRISPELPIIDSKDGEKILRNKGWNLFMGHRRLSIIDLSSRGHQPMPNEDQSVWISYNGEIYNFRELREELRSHGFKFNSTSDTEVLIRGYEQWGIDVINRLNGMFAFSLWDARKKELFLARDRYGIKPLYYFKSDDQLIFASEIKSITSYLQNKQSVDLLALNEYFSFQNTFTDRTLFNNISLLPAGNYVRIKPGNASFETHQYWDFDFSGESDMPEQDQSNALYELIKQAVTKQCVADVPIGTYLSGGLDSGTITALATKQLGRISTFTAGFDMSEAAEHEMRFDERETAEKMASLFQTEHYECVLHAGDMAAVIEDLIWHLEDLRAGQCYPNFNIARLAGKFVKVVMSGTGGDELFGGYPWRYAAAVAPHHEDYIQNYYHYWKRLVRNNEKPLFFNDQIVNELKNMNDEGAVPFQNHTISSFRRVFKNNISAATISEQINNSLYFECKTFLHALLLIEDKLSMAHSLETRVPLLDNDLVDFACKVPASRKVSGFNHLERIDENLLRKKQYYREKMQMGKNILRSAMERILPPDIVLGQKQGFSAPDESWFRGGCAIYVRDTLLPKDAAIYDYINRDYVEQVLDSHTRKVSNRRLLIWSLLCFEIWLRKYMKGEE